MNFLSTVPLTWNKKLPWMPEMIISGETYHYEYDLAPELKAVAFSSQTIQQHEILVGGENALVSRCGRWAYVRNILRGGQWLENACYGKLGRLFLTRDAVMPALCEWNGKRWQTWMSFTPQEHFTLRPGTELARGHTVIGGLGMGYQLIEVSRRQSVSEITVIEREQAVVDLLWKKILQLCAPMSIRLIVGDVDRVLPKLRADVALIDTFPKYGCNADQLRRMKNRNGGKIAEWWGWGCDELEFNDLELKQFLKTGKVSGARELNFELYSNLVASGYRT